MAISRVSFAKGGTAGTTASSIATASFSAVVGNTILVFIRLSTAGISSVTDTAGNTYNLLTSTSAPGVTLYVYAATNVIANASNVVTVNMTASHTFCWVAAVQYSGTNLSVDVKDSAPNSVAATDLVTNAFSTGSANEAVVVGASGNGLATYTAGASFTLIDGSIGSGTSFFGGIEEYLPAPQLSSFVGHITQSVSIAYAIAWITLQESLSSLLSSSTMLAT